MKLSSSEINAMVSDARPVAIAMAANDGGAALAVLDALTDASKQMIDLNRLLEFAQRIVSAAAEGGDIDVSKVHDAALSCGLIEPVEVTEPCGELCPCAEVGFPITCLRPTDLLQRK